MPEGSPLTPQQQFMAAASGQQWTDWLSLVNVVLVLIVLILVAFAYKYSTKLPVAATTSTS